MLCINCNINPAKYREENKPKQVYCGSVCQRKYYSIGLKDYSVNPPIVDDDIVELNATGGYAIRITRRQANEMRTVENLIEEVSADNSIPVNTSNEVLLQIQDFFYHGHVVTSNLTDEQFLNLLKAANYLDFSRLYYHLMPEWVNRRPFPGDNILNDMVPTALYFYEGTDFTIERFNNLSDNVKNRFIDFITGLEDNIQWNIRMAVTDGNLEVVNALLQNWRVDPSARSNICIGLAAEYGYLSVVNRLLEDHRVNPADDDNYAIHMSAEDGRLDIVNRLLEDPRVNPASRNNYAIRKAASKGHENVVERLLKDQRVDPATGDNYPIRAAAYSGHANVVERLLKDPRVDPTAKNSYAIYIAAKIGHVDVVRVLLKDERADPNELKNFLGNPEIQVLYQEYTSGGKKQRIQSFLLK